MAAGTIRNAVNQMLAAGSWENKKKSGNLLKKKDAELTPQERMIQDFKEQLEANRESEKYNQIYTKLMSGQDLTREELDRLKQKDPKAYMEYKADKMEQKAYERRLRNCKTKEEAERLHVNKMNGKLSELKSVVNNPNIPKSEKVKAAKRILGDTRRTVQVYHDFTKSAAFGQLPTEEEVRRAKHLQAEEKEAEISSDNKEQPEYETDDSGVAQELTEDKDTAKVEKKILEEMLELEEKHFGEQKKAVQIDVSL